MSTTQVPTQPGGPPTATRIPSGRITAAQLEALAARVRTAGPREHMEIEQPFNGELLGCVPKCAPEDVEAAIARARLVQEAWARTKFGERREILRRFHDLVLARQDEILDLVQIESGKARKHAFEEVLDVAIVARYYANTAERHLASRRRRGALPLLTAAYEHHHPLGVVGIIAPWNYPLTLSVTDAVPALAGRQRRRASSPTARRPSRRCGASRCSRRPGCPQGLCAGRDRRGIGARHAADRRHRLRHVHRQHRAPAARSPSRRAASG